MTVHIFQHTAVKSVEVETCPKKQKKHMKNRQKKNPKPPHNRSRPVETSVCRLVLCGCFSSAKTNVWVVGILEKMKGIRLVKGKKKKSCTQPVFFLHESFGGGRFFFLFRASFFFFCPSFFLPRSSFSSSALILLCVPLLLLLLSFWWVDR